jgi:hypothetical protein
VKPKVERNSAEPQDSLGEEMVKSCIPKCLKEKCLVIMSQTRPNRYEVAEEKLNPFQPVSARAFDRQGSHRSTNTGAREIPPVPQEEVRGQRSTTHAVAGIPRGIKKQKIPVMAR